MSEGYEVPTELPGSTGYYYYVPVIYIKYKCLYVLCIFNINLLLYIYFYLPIRLFCAVFAALFAEGLLSSTSDSIIVHLANGGFACDIRYHIIGVCLSSFACRPATASVAVLL